VAVRDAVLEVKIEGKAIDKSSVYVGEGFFRGSDNTLVWNSSSLDDLVIINPGEGGTARFRFSLVDSLFSQTVEDENLTVKLSARMFVNEPPAGFENFDIKSEEVKELKVSSRLQFASRALYYSGPFQNTGPLPPKVGEETSYTIVWSLTNSLNNLSDVVVKSSLPSYMKWAGEILPSGEDLIYNSTTGEVIWQVGKVLAGTGVFRPAKEVSFKVILTPAVNQVGKQVVLISEAVAEGKDDFTGVLLRQKRSALNTNLKNDAQFQYGQAAVVE
jgi:hypothetical protein